MMMSTLKTLNVIGITRNVNANGYSAVILGEEDGDRKLQIVIGVAEAQAIEIMLLGIKPPRPLTHDLYVSTLDQFGIKVEKIELKLLDDVYAAEIVAYDGIRRISIDARASDAIALALRWKIPVVASEQMLNSVGLKCAVRPPLIRQQAIVKLDKPESNGFDGISSDSLRIKLKEAARTEHYELASAIKAELDRRKTIINDGNINGLNSEEEYKNEKS
jgi:hypothetical protein